MIHIQDSFIRTIYQEDLASLIVKLDKERSLLSEIEGNGRKAVMEKYNWNIDKKRLILVYKELSEVRNKQLKLI